MSYPPFRNRIYAFLLDYLIIASYGVLVVGSISVIFRAYLVPLFSTSPAIAQLTGFLLMTLPVSLYFMLCECSNWQGTVGKRKMGLRVTNKSGERIGIGRSMLRTFIKFLPWELAHFGIWRIMLPSDYKEVTLYVVLVAANLAILLYLLLPFTNKKRKNLYDWIAGTEVVR